MIINISLVLLLVASEAFQPNIRFVKRYEAEQGILKGLKIIKNDKGNSGIGFVTDFTNAEKSLMLKINVPRANNYKLSLSYRVQKNSGDKYTGISINGQQYREIELKENGEFTTKTMTVSLQKGINIFKLYNGWGYFDIDYIQIEEDISLKKHQRLVNKNASLETRKLMNFLLDTNGKKIISGQQDFSDVEWISSNFGKKPAIVGFDFLNYTVEDSTHAYQDVEKAISWSKNGGIVAFLWHWIAPKNKENEKVDYKRGFYTKYTSFDIKYALENQNSEEYQLLIRDIDKIAYQLKRLEQEKIPILFRPLHEAEGKWFWWGAKGPEYAIELYHLLYNRLTNIHKINNLIWVWNSISPQWYPGDDYVDIISYDSYPSAGDYSSQSVKYDLAMSLGKGNKLVAMSENGSIPDPELLKSYNISWSWFMTWRQEYLKNGIFNDYDHLAKVYTNEYVITLDELPSFK